MTEMTPTMSMRSTTDLFAHELSDLRSAEDIIATMLRDARGLVQDPELRQDIDRHSQETLQHGAVLDQVFETMGLERHPVTCHAVAGLRQSLQEALGADPSPEVIEGLVVGELTLAEHLEIAAYNGLITKAQAMGQNEVVTLLQQNLQQEQVASERMRAACHRLAGQMIPAG
jgi:ferritin-like metal-binding protein YciE